MTPSLNLCCQSLFKLANFVVKFEVLREIVKPVVMDTVILFELHRFAIQGIQVLVVVPGYHI